MNVRILGIVAAIVFPFIIPSPTLAEFQELSDNTFYQLAPIQPLLSSVDTVVLSNDTQMAHLLQLVAKLQAQLTALLEQQGHTIDNEKKRFTLPIETFEGAGIKVAGDGSNSGPFIGDGNDIDDDSLQFQIKLNITNTDLSKSLIIDRDSIKVVPIDAAGNVVKPKRTFGVQTGIQIAAEYAFDKNERKLIVIEPGQTSKVQLHHVFQFSEAGTYRGKLSTLQFTHDTVEYNAKENQFTQKGRTYSLDRDTLQTLPIKFQTLLIKSTFKSDSDVDNVINLKQFFDKETGVRFDYPDDFEIVHDGGDTQFMYNGVPQIIYSTVRGPRFNTVKLRDEKVSMFQSDRIRKKTQTFIDNDVSGVAVTITPMTGDFYALTTLEYSDNKNNFIKYNFIDIVQATFERK